MALHPEFLRAPVAHRALHDVAAGVPENGRAAIRAAMEAGYGIEIDIQPSRDGVAMVFHDYDLGRLTHETGAIAQRDAADLAGIPLRGGAREDTIPTLRDVLAMVAGRVPLLIEIKDQDGALGPNVGPLEAAVAADLAGYRGPVAVMSFNPHSMVAMAKHAPDVARGLVTCAYDAADWGLVPGPRRAALASIQDFAQSGACFISHDRRALDMAEVAALKSNGVPILCWTVRDPDQEAQAREIADNITFEGYSAPHP